MKNITHILKEYFGHSAFRDGQQPLVDGILQGRDVLGIMPTGAGKSVCYQVPALAMGGVTIVISPLISLMKDQVNALVQSGISAGYINSSLTAEQSRQIYRRTYSGEIKILYVAPERLLSDAFLNMAKQIKIAMITVDEAHCISQWGQDFRPSYLKIAEFISLLPVRPVVSAFTATATVRVRNDIIDLLKLNNPIVITKGFDRRNLYFGVQRPKDKYTALATILHNNKDKCAIVYCITRKKVEEVCQKLSANGFNATRYHAGLTDAERRQNQEDFIFDRKTIMVATNAFGMGIDKSNVGLVVHYNMPKDIESYYQEAGRAGRDGTNASCILLFSGQDVRTNRFLIDNSEARDDLTPEMRATIRKQELARLEKMVAYCTSSDCLREYILNYFGDTAPDYCGQCSSCLSNFETVDITIEAQKIVSCVYRLKKRSKSYGKTMLIDILRGSKTEKIVQNNLQTLTTYGIMQNYSAEQLGNIIDYLVLQKYLQTDEFSALVPTQFSAEIVKNKKPIAMKMLKQLHKQFAEVSSVYDIDYNLLSGLKALRSELARKEGVPAYIVFSDAALRDMCRKLPTTDEQFINVSGVGRLKAEKYSTVFCGFIYNYINKNENPTEHKRENKKSYQPWKKLRTNSLNRNLIRVWA